MVEKTGDNLTDGTPHLPPYTDMHIHGSCFFALTLIQLYIQLAAVSLH